MISLKPERSGSEIINLKEIVEKKSFDLDTIRLNIGGGDVLYSNCLNLELEEHKDVEGDVYGDITKGLKFEDESFQEVLMIHVIEHIERKLHPFVFDEIWRILKPGCRLVMGFPDVIECMKRFIDNKFGARWESYHWTIFGRQSRNGDYHVTGIERQDITDRLLSSGFNNINYSKNKINVTLTATKSKKLKEYL